MISKTKQSYTRILNVTIVNFHFLDRECNENSDSRKRGIKLCMHEGDIAAQIHISFNLELGSITHQIWISIRKKLEKFVRSKTNEHRSSSSPILD
jgi:hypothetical protein